MYLLGEDEKHALNEFSLHYLVNDYQPITTIGQDDFGRPTLLHVCDVPRTHTSLAEDGSA